MKNELKKNNAITLITLVITIILLLILAGITISLAVRENGLIERTKESRENMELAMEEQKKDIEGLISYEQSMQQSTKKVDPVSDSNPGVLEANGTENEPFEINSIEDLVFFSNNVLSGNNYDGEYISLKVDLDFKSEDSYVNAQTTAFGDINQDGKTQGLIEELSSGKGFSPIGNFNDEPIPFAGTFDGENHFIKNMYINNVTDNGDTVENDIGLFGYNTGTIKNIRNIDININVKARIDADIVGGIAGVNGRKCAKLSNNWKDKSGKWIRFYSRWSYRSNRSDI